MKHEIPVGYAHATPILLSYGCDLGGVGSASRQYSSKLHSIEYDRKTYFNEVELRAAIEESRAQLKPDAVLASEVAEEKNVSRRAIEKISNTRNLWRSYHLGRLYVSRSDFFEYKTSRPGLKKDPIEVPVGYLSVFDASERLGLNSPFPLGNFLRHNKDIPRVSANRRIYLHFDALAKAYKDPNRKGRASLGARPAFLAEAVAPAQSVGPQLAPVSAAVLTPSAPPIPTLPAPAPTFSLSALLPTVVAELRAAGFSGTAKLDIKTGKLIATRTVRVEVEL